MINRIKNRIDIEREAIFFRKKIGVKRSDAILLARNMKKADVPVCDVIEEKLYLTPRKHWPKDGRKVAIECLAESNGVTYGEAYKRSKYIREQFGLSAKRVYFDDLYYVDDDYLRIAKENRERIKKSRLDKIIRESPYDRENTICRLEEINKKFGFSEYVVLQNNLIGLTDDELKKRKEASRKKIKEQYDYILNQTGWSIEQVKRHVSKCSVKYRMSLGNYIMLKAWENDFDTLDTYLTNMQTSILNYYYNDQSKRDLFEDKKAFINVFSDYVCRDSWINENTSFEEFNLFIKDKKKLFYKPYFTYGGKGATIIDVRGNLLNLYQDIMNKPRGLFEEYIEQHHDIAQFHEKSLNTIRVYTLIDDYGKFNILFAIFRTGNGDVIDNITSGGICAGVDVKTGIVNTAGTNKRGETFERHPISEKMYKNFQIPHWNSVINMIKNASQVVPEIRFVGWDVAVCEDKVILVEGNTYPGFTMVQSHFIAEHIGKKCVVEPFLPDHWIPFNGFV